VNALVSRQSIEQICAARDETLRRFDVAFKHIATAGEAVAEAKKMWEVASPGRHGHWSDQDRECKSFFNAVSVPNKDEYQRTARKLVDVTVWTHLIDLSGIEALMDAQAKKELRDQMRYVPDRTDRDGQLINQDEIARMLPEVTVENVYATLERFKLDAEMIFRRGIVNVFSKLDRRFRSHDGFKVGSRMILNYIAGADDGRVRTYGDKADLLHDVERTFLVLDGQDARATYASLLARIEHERRGNWKPMQSEHEAAYFKIRIFKNGNAHLWFTRKDLVEKVNKILADHYGEVIGDGMTKEADPLQDKKLTPARRFGFFPSPDEVAERVIRNAYVLRSAEQEQLRILEPSAGTGSLARRCVKRFDPKDWGYQAERYRAEYRWDNLVDCVEIQPELAHQLMAENIYNRVTCADFLAIRPNEHRLYDRVVMNPPFDRERDIDHVTHALDFLKPDGCLIAVMSAGTEFRETKKSVAFRALIEKMGGVWDDLPPGSFAETGTYVNTLILRVWKDGRRQYGLER
jgi:hypothetical protein